MKGNVVMN